MPAGRDTPDAGGPLAGMRVVDLTTSYAGPTASMYLADLGADVIKIERPGRGDDCRQWGPPFVDGTSAWFASVNRNKRSMALDITSAGGLVVLYRLLDTADVFLQNTNPAKLARLGIDEATVRARNPRLVYCALSGFGIDGPDQALPGYDLVAQARSGLMSVTGAKGGAPQRVSTALSDIVTGLAAMAAICAALLRQARTGQGDSLDVSLLDTDLALMAPRLAALHAGEPEPAPSGGTDSVLAVYQPFETADRTIVVAVGNDGIWRRFCAVVGLPDLAADPALADNAGRREHRSRITEAVAQRLRDRPAEDWLARFAAAEVPAARVQRLGEVVTDAHVRAREALLDVAGHDGRLVSVRSPFRLASMPRPRNEVVPDLGQDNAAVLAGLGYTEAEVADLTAGGAFGPVGSLAAASTERGAAS